MRQAVAFVLVSAIIVGCAAPSRRFATRRASEAEARVLAEAIRPLLQELDYPLPVRPDDCRVGLVILVSPVINAAAGPGQAAPCVFFTLGVTEGAVRRLSVDMLRAILAHELGHVQLGHFDAKKARAGTPIIFRPVSRVFGRAQEEDADRFAVQLLRKINAQHPGACLALVYVFALLAEQPAAPGAWRSIHPSPERRADTALAGCQRSESSNF
jgi:Zn-dependent protease with chaperone function